MPEDYRWWQNCHKRKYQSGDLAGAVVQNLRNRCCCLPRLPKREDVQGCASAPTSMQQPTNGIDMMTICNEKNISPASCEKITLFRHAIVLPKIKIPDTSRPSTDQSTALLDHIHDNFQHRRGYHAPNLPARR